MKHIAAGLVAAFALAGCQDPTLAPDAREAPSSVVSTRDTAALFQTDSLAYTLRAGVSGYEGEIGVTLTNRTNGTIYIVNCREATGVRLEKRTSTGWQTVWSPHIPSCMSAPIVVPVGGVRRTRIPIFGGYPNSNAHPQFSVADVAGEYRAVWGSVLSSYQDRLPFGEPLPLESRTSNRFTLRTEPR